MNFKDNDFGISPNAMRSATEVESPGLPPGTELTEDERIVCDYIFEHLRKARLEHVTAGITVLVTARTYLDWEEAVRLCRQKGRVQISKKNGYATPYPWANDETRLKMELAQWLAKLNMTLPSLQRARKDAPVKGQQDDLFSELVSHATSSPARSSMN